MYVPHERSLRPPAVPAAGPPRPRRVHATRPRRQDDAAMTAPAMMRSVYRSRYGGPEVLEVREVPTPVPGPDEVLVRVQATTVSRTDCGGLRGAPLVYRCFTGLARPRHRATGCDFAGDVEA